jgi:hypothetical protein
MKQISMRCAEKTILNSKFKKIIKTPARCHILAARMFSFAVVKKMQ